MAKFLSIRWVIIENAMAVALVILGADRSMAAQLIGWGLLLPGSAIAAGIEGIIAPLTGRPGGSFAFWNIASAVFLPCCVALNLLTLWGARRVHARRAQPEGRSPQQ